MKRKVQKKKLVTMIALLIAFAALIILSRIASPAEFPDEIMGIDLMQALDKTISDIDSSFESLKSSEEGIEIQIDELQKQIDRAAQDIIKEMKPGKRYSKAQIYGLIGSNAELVRLQEKAIKLYKQMLYKRIGTVTEVMDLNTKLGDLLKHKEMLDEEGKLDKEAIYKHEDGILNFAKAFAGLEDLVNGEFFDDMASVDPMMKRRQNTIKYSWELFQSQLEDFLAADGESLDTEWIVEYYSEIQNNIDATLNEAYLMLDESLAWEDRLKQRGLTIAMELLYAKLNRTHQKVGSLRRPPKVRTMPRIGSIISRNAGQTQITATASEKGTTGESWRDRVERIEKQIKARREEREGK
ncbi:hypothetical protein ACFL6S_24960 [Candidatus Poribacteria bacterium]